MTPLRPPAVREAGLVGLDLVFLVPGQTGGRETHTRELLKAIAARPDRPEIVAFLGADAAAAAPGWWTELPDRVVVLSRASATRRASWAAAEALGVGRAAARAGVDLVHGPANFAPFGGPFARVVTVHDVGFRRVPELMTPAMRAGTELLVPPAARRAHRVITVSAASRDDLVAQLKVDPARIDVIPNGVAAPPPVPAGERRTILAVATNLPHKNLETVVEAVRRLASPLPLVVAGARTESLDGAGLDATFLGAVDAPTLERLYAEAAVYVTTTRYEGFGLPVLEAMARGVPVVCSDLPVLREVAGDVAFFADPQDPGAVAAAVERALREGDTRLEAGRAQASRFPWDAAAEATLAAYERAVATHRRGGR
jgi:glycosyltransferase involved in cell wall biosynthesis